MLCRQNSKHVHHDAVTGRFVRKRANRYSTLKDGRVYAWCVLRILRLAILAVICVWTLGLVVAAGRPETGLLEDIVLGGLVLAMLMLAVPVRRIGALR